MRIGILSDTHDRISRTGLAIRLLVEAGAEALVHCGDFTRPDVADELAAPGLPVHAVLGNNDDDAAGLRRALATTGGTFLGRGGLIACGGKRLAVTHGDSAGELRRLAAESPDYLFYGHTHVAADHREGPTRWINPGALSRAASWTVALLDLDADALTVLTVGRGDRHGR